MIYSRDPEAGLEIGKSQVLVIMVVLELSEGNPNEKLLYK